MCGVIVCAVGKIVFILTTSRALFYRVIFVWPEEGVMDKLRNPEGSVSSSKMPEIFSQYKRLLRSNWEINSITSNYTQINYI